MAQRRSADDAKLSSRARTVTGEVGQGNEVDSKFMCDCEVDTATRCSGKASAEPLQKLDKHLAELCVECPVCLQACVHPVKLPCGHVFCFLCVKGVANQSKRCALCRQDIPAEFFNHPDLLKPELLLEETTFEGCYQWFYQGHNGWWQYDDRTSADIEEQFKEGQKSLEMLIAGFLYIIDLENMFQYQRNDPSRRRKIKRDLKDIPDKKGVAGLKVHSSTTPCRREGDGGERVPAVTPATPGTRLINSPTVRPQLESPVPSDSAQGGPLHTSPATPLDTPTDNAEQDTSVSSANDVSQDLQNLNLSEENGNSDPPPEGSSSSSSTRPSRIPRNRPPLQAQVNSDSSSSGEDWN